MRAQVVRELLVVVGHHEIGNWWNESVREHSVR